MGRSLATALTRDRLKQYIRGSQVNCNSSLLRSVELGDEPLPPDQAALLAIDLHRNFISRLPRTLPFPRLTTLDLSCNEFVEFPVLHIPTLRSLSLAHNRLSGYGPLTGLPQLTHLDLRSNKIHTLDVAALAPVAATLEWLSLSSNGITAVLLASSSSSGPATVFPRLQTVSLFGHNLSAEVLGQLLAGDRVPRLRVLVAGLPLGGGGPSTTSECHRLDPAAAAAVPAWVPPSVRWLDWTFIPPPEDRG
ncbi:hypothetical protein PAPYR_3284 [Paratrimastix pyriformis]|uniref:Uncharacterized protein n=1 Tax=Paratrimastix pyriformis TaxID=342808 RepID=A0ABQ8UQR8_9EUKA|nr:hypothetical protein PAPYR_3284 [Paratrimastix pyriformis]